jgi:hypothetical protein
MTRDPPGARARRIAASVAEAGIETEPAHDDDYDHDHAPSRSYPPAPDDDH